MPSPGRPVRPAIFYRVRNQKWEVMRFDEPLDCWLTAIEYLRRGYTVGLNQEAQDGIADLVIPSRSRLFGWTESVGWRRRDRSKP